MPRSFLGELLLALLLSAALTPRAGAGDKDLEGLKAEVFAARRKLLLAQGEERALEIERKAPLVPPDVGENRTPAAVGVPETLRNILKGRLSSDDSRKNRDDALVDLEEVARKKLEDAEELCKGATSSRMRLLEDLAAEEKRLGLRVADVGDDLRIDWLPSHGGFTWDGPAARDVLWLWLLATTSLWLCARVARRERRGRWHRHGRRAKLVLALVLTAAGLAWVGVLAVAVFALVSRRVPPVGRAESPHRALQDALRSAKGAWDADREARAGENENKRRAVEAARVAALRRWGEALGLTNPNPAAVEPEQAEYDVAVRLHSVLVEVHAAHLFAADAKAVAEQVEQDRLDLPEKVARRAASAAPWAWARLIASGALVLVAPVPPLVLLWRRRRRLRRDAERCPCCQEFGKLADVDAPGRDRRCAVCGFQCRTGQLRLPRLCFPTVGLPESDKSPWLVTTYRQINEQRLPTRARLSGSLSLQDESLDGLLRQLRRDHRGPQVTQAAEEQFPCPIPLHVEDRDAPPNQVMLNLFHFGDAVQTDDLPASVLPRHALTMDGFIVFLDATRPPEEHFLQQELFRRFAQDVRHRLGVPVAVCLPKLDLLPTQTEFGSRAMPWLRKLRQTEGLAVTAATLRRRSQLVREALVTLFPRWPVEEDLYNNFGHNYLFFPLTAVGLEESELLGPDPANRDERTFAPFGLGEPILWLLHVHGYKVLG